MNVLVRAVLLDAAPLDVQRNATDAALVTLRTRHPTSAPLDDME